MPTQMKRCSTPSCSTRVPLGVGRCPDCQAKAEARRGTAAARGYGHQHHSGFREGVLAKHPVCVLCRRAPATVADHWPKSRRELEQLGLDPNDPRHGRGLCKRCHDRETARLQPGGWHAG